jgi:phosphoserine aminotransferase
MYREITEDMWELPELESGRKYDFIHYCDNETGSGFEFNGTFPFHKYPGIPVVADMSSNIGSKTIDWNKYGAIYACAQKNIGVAGVTMLAVRKSLLQKEELGLDICPSSLNWTKVSNAKGQIFNTPDVAAVYLMNLRVKYSIEKGNIHHRERQAAQKSGMIYDIIDDSDGFYYNHIIGPWRSRMNQTFIIDGGNKELEERFKREALERIGLHYIAPHHCIGKGIRFSTYNAQPMEAVREVANFMEDFMIENKK